VCRDADARREQLGARGRDHEALVGSLDAEGNGVERAARRTVLHLGLRHRGLEVHVPHGGRLDAVDVALLPEIAKAQLGEVPAALVDGRVFLAPVDRETDPSPERPEGLLVLVGEPQTELDEIRTRHYARRSLRLRRRRELEPQPRHRGGLRIAAHVEIGLDTALGRQPVVVPAHRVEDVAAAHAVVAHHHVGMRVAEDVPHVQRARDGRRWRVDDEGLLASATGIVRVYAQSVPVRVPALLGFRRLEVLRQAREIDRPDSGHRKDG
jgi:hypothetical protein